MMVRCPFCGSEVEYGLALCVGCNADVGYDEAERSKLSVDDQLRLDRLCNAAAKAQVAAESAPWGFRKMAAKDAARKTAEYEQMATDLTMRAGAAVDRRLIRGDTNSAVSFRRGDRVIETLVYLPHNPGAKVDFDVILKSHDGQKIKLITAIRKVGQLAFAPALQIYDNAPATVLKGVSALEAEDARRELEAAGGSIELW